MIEMDIEILQWNAPLSVSYSSMAIEPAQMVSDKILHLTMNTVTKPRQKYLSRPV